MARSKRQINDGATVDEAVRQLAVGWADGTRVCVALSGGIDSVVLLHAMARLRDSRHASWLLSAHHVHHGLSPNADAWALHCEAMCSALKVPLTIDRVHVDRNSRMGIEAAARAARYQSLDKIAAQTVLLAHHARDQAETVLLQLLRGSGAPGLAAMPENAGRYERPLLGVSKVAIAAYAADAACAAYAAPHSLTWVEDESNADVRFARNRLRAQVWPELIRAFPAAEVTLSRAAAHQAEAVVLLDDLAALDAVRCVVNDALQLAAFNALSRPRKANVLRHWLTTSRVDIPGTETLREWLQQLASDEPTQSICLRCADGETALRVYRGAAWVVRGVPRWHAALWRGESDVALQGDRGVAGRVTARLSADTKALRLPLENEHWTLRMREEGDAIELSPRSGRVTVKNVFQNAGVPPWQRERWPLLASGSTVVSVVGIATANAFTVHGGEEGLRLDWRAREWKPA